MDILFESITRWADEEFLPAMQRNADAIAVALAPFHPLMLRYRAEMRHARFKHRQLRNPLI